MSISRGSRASGLFGMAIAVLAIRTVIAIFTVLLKIALLPLFVPLFPSRAGRLLLGKPSREVEYEYYDPPPGYEPLFTFQRGKQLRRIKITRTIQPGDAALKQTLSSQRSSGTKREPIVAPRAPVEQDLFLTLKTLGFSDSQSSLTAKHVFLCNSALDLNALIKIALQELRP